MLLCDPILYVNQAKICLSFSESEQCKHFTIYLSLLADDVSAEIEQDFYFLASSAIDVLAITLLLN